VYVFSWFMCVQIKIDFFKHEEIVQLGNGLYSVMIKKKHFFGICLTIIIRLQIKKS
jgi:hypothetical protein